MKAIGFPIAAVFFALLLALFVPDFSYSEDTVDLSIFSFEGGARAVIETAAPVEFGQGRLSRPERFYIDLKGNIVQNGGLGLRKKEFEGEGIVTRVRLARFDAETIRVVFDLAGEAKASVERLENPSRIVVEFEGSPVVQSPGLKVSAPREALSGKGGGAKAEDFKPKTRIVVDAGHGGHDPGAIGPGGLREKDVTLAIALELAKILGNSPLYDVKLTRDRDVYLTLEERTVIANRFNADLFLSVHINASPRRDARGIETYFLNWSDDEEANRVAARENAISVKRLKEARTELGFILASLELQDKRDDSLKLAHHIQRSVVSSVAGEHPELPDHGVKQALFYVLVGAKMPSILTEISFISNRRDEGLLRDRGYRRSVAEGIARGIETYLREFPSQDVAKR
jgi:N-acetylmuramoyl-L-alanine amidase